MLSEVATLVLNVCHQIFHWHNPNSENRIFNGGLFLILWSTGEKGEHWGKKNAEKWLEEGWETKLAVEIFTSMQSFKKKQICPFYISYLLYIFKVIWPNKSILAHRKTPS